MITLALSLAVTLAGPPAGSPFAVTTPSTATERVAPAPLQPSLEQVSFEEAVRRALERNISTLVAAEEVRRADGLLWQARSGALPTLVAGGALTHLDAERRSSSGISAAQDQRSANLTLSIPVFAPSRWYQWAHGSQAVETALASEQDLRRTVALTTGRAYLTVIAQRRTLAVAIRARDNSRAHYDFAHARRTAGTGTALDELRAEQQLATNQAQVERTYAALAQAREALGILTGDNAPLDAAAEPELPAAAEPDQAIREAEQRRQDVKAGQARAFAAERLAADSWSDWLPTLLATGQAFHQNPPTTSNPNTGWQVQLVLSWPLFEGGLRSGQARERDALANETAAQLDLLLRQARSDVRLAWETMIRSESAYRESKRAADRADTVLLLATQAYKAGALNSLDVIDAERQARDAETTAIVAEDAVRQSRLSLLAATGRFP